MNIPRQTISPRARLWVACGLMLGLSLLTVPGGVSMASVARWLLGALALGGLGWWWMRQGSGAARFALPERLRVVSRTGLSPRCGLALVEVDGRPYLVAHGESFAEIRGLRPRRRLEAQPSEEHVERESVVSREEAS